MKEKQDRPICSLCKKEKSITWVRSDRMEKLHLCPSCNKEWTKNDVRL